MQFSRLDTQLDLLESQFNILAASLMDGRSDAFLSDGARLQRLAVEMVRMVQAVGHAEFNTPSRMQRIKILASGMANVRESLARHMAYVDRALEIVVPATRDKSTYAGGGVYGQPVRQSGAFSVLSA